MKTKISLERAEEIAQKYIKILDPHCAKIEIAGSIRRKKPEVGDIEICLIPQSQVIYDMFNVAIDVRYPVYDMISKVFKDYHYVASGKRLKKIYIPDSEVDVIQLDLFIVLPPAQWGYRFAICTGPAEFNRWLVTPKNKGGAFPSHCRTEDGCIYEGGAPVLMPTEESYFDWLGVPYMAPEDRKPPETWIPF